MLEILLKTVGEHYKNDPCTAGVSLAILPKGEFYGSICRYTQRLGQGKLVVVKERDVSLERMLLKLAFSWYAEIGRDATGTEEFQKLIVELRACMEK